MRVVLPGTCFAGASHKLSGAHSSRQFSSGRCSHRRSTVAAAVTLRTNSKGPPGPPPPAQGDGDGGGGSSSRQDGHELPLSELTASREDVIVIDVTGMHCAGCVAKVKRILEAHPRVKQASVNLATEVALVRILVPTGLEAAKDGAVQQDMAHSISDQLLEVLSSNGFASKIRDASQSNAAAAAVVTARREERKQRMREASWRVAGAWLLASACLVGHLPHWWSAAPAFLHRFASPRLHAALSAAALLGPGRQIVVRGWESMLRRRPDMNSLVALGACASFGVSGAAAALPSLGWPTFFEEPAMLLGCVLLGRALEERAKLAASSDLAALQGLVPDRARLELTAFGDWREVPTAALAEGDILTVLPGDRIPVDGTVASGISSANEAALTGEPMPVPKAAGSEVVAGTVNVEGRLRVRVARAGAATTMADILRLVETAQARTAPVQRVADAVSGRFSVGVMLASTATLAFWAVAGPRLFPQAVATYCGARGAGAAGGLLLSLQLACNVMTVACPCALGLAAPTAVLVATSAAARRGLLIRGGDILEAASQIDTILFDKTGTLTEGLPKVQRIETASRHNSETQLLSLAAALERESSHPLAAAILSAAQEAGCDQHAVEEGSCEQVPGSGIRGKVEGTQVAVGTEDWVLSDLATEERRTASRLAETSSSASDGMQMFVSVDGRLAGIVTLADTIRPDAAATVAHLRSSGFAVHMLSGDTAAAAQGVAAAVGIAASDVHAGVKPAQKAKLVRELQSRGRRVAMVGDGINDAGALAAADVGLAMGGGVDAASEVANVVLLGNKLVQVAEAFDISKRAFTKIQQNLCWAFGYNAIGLPVAAGALLPKWGLALTPSLSGALMGLSSLAVMGNSMLLQVQKPVGLKTPVKSKAENMVHRTESSDTQTSQDRIKYTERTLA